MSYEIQVIISIVLLARLLDWKKLGVLGILEITKTAFVFTQKAGLELC